jgi:hypothetical protein
MFHRGSSEVSVQVKLASEFGLSVNQLIMALLLVVMGVLTYYVAPASFLYKNLGMFFGVLNLLLILMILGMTFITILLFPKLQSLCLSLFMCCFRNDRRLEQVVRKNLTSHQSRNQKTAMMFAICMSFLIFSASSFQLLSMLMESQLNNMVGADLYAFSFDTVAMSSMINDGEIDAFLRSQNETYGDVLEWTYVSFNLEDILRRIMPKGYSKMYLSDYSGYKGVHSNVYAVKPNYLRTLDLQYYFPREIEADIQKDLAILPNGEPDPIQALYSDKMISPNKNGSKDPFLITKPNFPPVKCVFARALSPIANLSTVCNCEP